MNKLPLLKAQRGFTKRISCLLNLFGSSDEVTGDLMPRER